MSGLTIKNEGAPKRCEVCHTSYYLEPNQTLCARCKKLDLPANLAKNKFNEEDDFSGFFFSFGRNKGTSVIAYFLITLFLINVIGLFGTVFLFGGVSSVLGLHQLTKDTVSKPSILQITFNIILIVLGLLSSYFSGIQVLGGSRLLP